MLSTLHAVAYSILLKSLWGKSCYYSRITDAKLSGGDVSLLFQGHSASEQINCIWSCNLCTKPLNCVFPSLAILKHSLMCQKFSLRGSCHCKVIPLQDWITTVISKIFHLIPAILKTETLHGAFLGIVSLCHLRILKKLGKSLKV